MILPSQEVTMYPVDDRLTLESLLSDPMTQLVMRSDNLTPADVVRAFDQARSGLPHRRQVPYGSLTTPRWMGVEHGIGWSVT
jgi:hypothetical protein